MKKAIVPLCLLIVIGLAIVVYINRFINYSIVEVDGYAFSTNSLATNLAKSEDKEEISTEKVAVSDVIYKSNKKFYVGEEKKKSINLDYPIISEDTSSIYIASSVGDLITEDFSHEVAYAGTIVTDSKLYNTVDYEQATDYTYIFVQMNNGIYVNTNEFKIKTYLDETIIPVNSFIRFTEKSINYYYLLNEKFVYESLPIVDGNDKVNIGEFEGTYNKFLIKMGIIRDPDQKYDENFEDENNTGNGTINGGDIEGNVSSEVADSNPEYIKKENREKEEKKYVAPEVTITNTYAKTYSYRGVLNISDPSAAISKSPVFEFSIDGVVVLRKTVNAKGPYKITGLLPSTKYTVTAYYEYLDEGGKKRQKKIMFNNKDYVDTFTTESTDNLNELEFTFGDVVADTNSFMIKSVKFKNDIEDEVLNGIKGVTIKTNESTFILTSAEIKYLLNLIDLDYTSAKILKSNTEYNAHFEVTDTAGNVLKAKNNAFSFKTKQKAPVAKINVSVSKNFTKATAVFNITNVDNVDVTRYYYNVYDDNNNLFATSQIYEGQDTYIISGLDTAKRYVVKVFSNYKTNDGYTFNDVEIGTLDFISFDIEKLGNIQFVVDLNSQRENYLTDHSASINIAYLNYDANDPLFELLDNNVNINIVNKETGEIEYTKAASKYDFITSTNYDIGYNEDDTKLKSNTAYDVTIETSVTSGTKKIPIRASINSKGFSFTTLKKEAYVTVSNLFIASGYIDFDAYVVDPDSAILDRNEETAESIRLEIYNRSKEKIYSEVLDITHSNKDTDMINNRITINTLDTNNAYDFVFRADNYNDNMNSESDKKLIGSNNFYITGLSANIDIEEMIKTVNYYHQSNENLFDLSDISRWKSTLASTFNTTERLTISNENNSITLGAYNGYRVYSYYLPELVGNSVVLSFKAKRGTEREGKICIMNSVSNAESKCTYVLDLSNDFQEFNDISFVLNSTGYISFYIAETDNEFYTNSIVLKDFQIEVGSETSEYKDYNSNRGYIGTFDTTAKIKNKAEDQNEGISVNQGTYEYYVSLIKDDVRSDDEVFNTDNGSFEDAEGIENTLVFSDIVKDSKYKVAFSVYDKDLERYYDLDVVSFESDNEIRVIRNITDFFNMHKSGYYIAVADLDFRNVSTVYSGYFEGTLDMQGHKILLGTSNRTYLFHTLGGGGTIKNADIHYYINNTTGKHYNYGLIYDNYGIIENIMLTIEESTNVSNYDWAFLGYRNYGIIKNFVFRSKAPIYGFRSMTMGVLNNYGTIKNGYVFADESSYVNNDPSNYGYTLDVSENIPTIDNNDKNSGIIARTTSSGSIIENIYINSKVYIGEYPEQRDKVVGTVVGVVSSATIRNIYVYDSSTPLNNSRSTNYDIMFGTVSNLNYNNLYYISEVEYNNTYSKPQQLTALKNVTFQDNTINSEKMFLTDKSWRLNIFPLLDLPECMPKQEYITIPSISGENLKFLAVDSVEYLDDEYSAKIAVSFYNPNGLVIRGVSIDDIGTVDLYGKPSTNSDKITTAILKLKNPAAYKSYYNLASVTVNSGTIEMNEQMAMDLYLEVSTVSAMTDMNTNYRLTEDVDCKVDKCKKLGTYYGKINGSGHTISNLTTDACFINYLRGSLENINFDNFVNSSKTAARVGIVCTLDSNGDMYNVHSSNSTLTAYSNNGIAYVGGLVGYVNNGTISHSSVLNLNINNTYLVTAIPNIGGLVGSGSNIIIDSSFARKITVDGTAVPADNSGIGGIIGVFGSGKISNVYATGKITNNTQYLGGIAGRISGSTAAVNSAISKVDIAADQDYIGGIDGYSVATNNISKTLVLNNLSTVKDDAEFFDRTSGTSINRSGNYAWDKQSLNNIVTSDTNGEQLLSQEDLWNSVIYSSKMGFGVEWALNNNFHEGYIPYLLTKEGKVARGQGFYPDENQDVSDLRIYYEELFKLNGYRINREATLYASGHENDEYYATQYLVDVYIENPRDYYIKSLVIEGLQLVETTIGATPEDNHITHMQFKYSPIKYFDNYVISKVIYEDDNREEQTEDVNLVMNLPFFGVIRNKTDWMNIEKNYYENYIIENDIDLSGLTKDQVSGKSFNRLVGYSGGKTKVSNASMSATKVGESLIDTIVTEISNIEFNNTYVKNTANGDFSGLIKYLNGTMNNMSFINTTIDTPKIRYTGVVAVNQAPEIRDIYVDTLTINGKTYVGFIGKSKSLPVTSVTLKNVTIDATSTYVGGLIGYETWKERGVYSSFIMGDNIKINQNTATYGNYVGGIFGYASGNNITIANSFVKGGERVGGIAGEHSNRYIYYNYVYNTEVEGTLYVGGATGRNQHMYGSLVYNSKVTGTSQVGGVSGQAPGLSMYGTGSVENTVTGSEYVGGLIGYISSSTAGYDFVRNTTVTGENYVGGIVGSAAVNDTLIRYCTTNATVTATNGSAGGIIGYVKNLNTTSSRYRMRIWHDIVAGSTVNAADFGGGIVGKTDIGMYKDQFHHLYVDANIKCDGNNCGYVNGTDDTYSTAITRLFIFENTGLTKNNVRTAFINSTQHATGSMYGSGTKSNVAKYDEIKTTKFWKTTMGITEFTYTDATLANFYPRPTYAEIKTKTIPDTIAEMPTSFVVTYKNNGDSTKTMIDFSLLPLPAKPNPADTNMGAGISPYHELPTANAYVSSIDTINIDFSDIDDSSMLVLGDKEYPIEHKTITFKYDFNKDLIFKITDGNLIREYNYAKEDIANRISVSDNFYYHIKDNRVISNRSGLNILNAVNIFNNKILLDTGEIYNIDDKSTTNNKISNYQFVDIIPLYEFEYLDETIKTFYSYSLVNNEYYDGQLFVKNDELEIIDSNLFNRKDRIIIDKYNNKNYLLYLDIGGSIHSLKDNIKYPDEFMNINIKDINSNVNSNADLLFVLYKDDSYIVFNYKTGTLIDRSEDIIPSVVEFVKLSYSLLVNAPELDAPVDTNYKETQKLISKLNEASIEEVLQKGDRSKADIDINPDGTKAKYAIKYNPKTNEYDVIEVKDSSDSIITQLNNPSVQEVINNNEVLSSYYNMNFVKKSLSASSMFERLIFIVFGVIIIAAIALLGDLVIKKIKVRS